MAHRQLTKDDRESIEYYLSLGYSQAYTARALEVHRSTITNELKRNGIGKGKYDAFFAQQLTDERKKRPSGYIGRLYKVKPRIGYRLPYNVLSVFDREFRLFKSIQIGRPTREQAKRDRRFEFRLYKPSEHPYYRWYTGQEFRIRIRKYSYEYNPFRFRSWEYTRRPFRNEKHRYRQYVRKLKRIHLPEEWGGAPFFSSASQRTEIPPLSLSECLTYQEICRQTEQYRNRQTQYCLKIQPSHKVPGEKYAQKPLKSGVKTKIASAGEGENLSLL